MSKFPVRHLEGFQDLPVVAPGLRWYVDRLREGRWFAVLKRTHGFWDRLADLAEVSPRFRALVEEAVRRDDDAFPARADIELALGLDADTVRELENRKRYKGYWYGQFPLDMLADLRNPPESEGWIEANALRGFTNSKDKPAHHSAAQLRDVVLAFRSRRLTYHDALVFKDTTITGELLTLFEPMRTMPVICVGPAHLAGLGRALSFPRYTHVDIHPTEAITHRDRTLAQLRALLSAEPLASEPKVVLFQAGSLSWWLMHRTWPQARRAHFVDLGRTLDLWFPDVVKMQPWFRADRDAIVRNMGLSKLYR